MRSREATSTEGGKAAPERRPDGAAGEAPSQVVPFVDLRVQYREIREDVAAAIERVCESGQFILGSEVALFEEEFAQFTGSSHAVGTNSGTGALLLALSSCGVEPGHEVIVPANTFISSVLAITHAGARPVLVDIDPESHLIDPKAAAAAVSRKTKAILPVHLFGQTCDMDAIQRIARRRGLRVVEDACQAHGALNRGRPAGSLGHVAAFSFYPGKNLGAYGDGGAVTTRSSSIARKVRALRNIGQSRKNRHAEIGFNDRLDSLQAAVLRVKLRRLAGWNDLRRKAAGLYTRLLSDTPLVMPVEEEGNRHVYHLYVVRAPGRDELAEHLNKRGIATGIHYPVPVHRQPCYADLGLPRGSFPHTEKAAREILSLPIFPEITPSQVEGVCDAIRDFYRSGFSGGANRENR